MDERNFRLWMEKEKNYNTARTYTARCIRVESEMGINLDEQFEKDQGSELMQKLKYSRKESREGLQPPCGIIFDVDVDAYSGMHSLRASVKKYFEYLRLIQIAQEENIGSKFAMEQMCISMNDSAVEVLKKRDKRLLKIIDYFGDIKCNVYNDAYEFIVYEIVGQMLSNKVAAKICDRLYSLCNGNVTVAKIKEFSVDELKSIGISRAKCEYILNFTKACDDGTIDFDELKTLPDDAIIDRLTSIRGIGKWTSKMYLIFVLQREDVLPYEDGAFLQGYKWLYNTDITEVGSIKNRCKKWKPYSSIAARYIYRAVDAGLIKNKFHLHKDIKGQENL